MALFSFLRSFAYVVGKLADVIDPEHKTAQAGGLKLEKRQPYNNVSPVCIPRLFESEGNWPRHSPEELKQLRTWIARARSDDPVASFELAVARLSRREFSQAGQWMWKAANNHDADAAAALGSMYRVGLGLPKDEIKADYWFKRSGNMVNTELLDLGQARGAAQYHEEESRQFQRFSKSGFKAIYAKFVSDDVGSIAFEECEWATFFSMNLPPRNESWGCYFGLNDISRPEGFRSHFSWVDSKEDLVCLFIYWCMNPAFLVPPERSSAEHEQARASLLWQLRKSNPNSSRLDLETFAKETINNTNVAHVEWAGSFAELANSGTDYSRLVRRWVRFRQAHSTSWGITRKDLEMFSDGPIEGDDLDPFRRSLQYWPGETFIRA